MTMLNIPGDAASLIREFGDPIPVAMRERFFTRVLHLLPADATPAAICAVCARVQQELLNAPAIGPSKPPPPRGPFRRRA